MIVDMIRPIHWELILVVSSMVLLSASATEFEALDNVRSRTPPSIQKKAAEDLLRRVILERSSDFLVTVDSSIGPPNRDTYKLVSEGERLSIAGTSGVAVAMGFYYYLKYKVGGQVTWAGRQTQIPETLPVIPSPGITMTTNDRFRYYQNVCTVSYSMAWWDWSRWEREIDWMALQGFNLPLAFTGQEAIFQKVYMGLGFTKQDLENHFGGPAFLAWARMGNVKGFGGPLPQAWMDNRLALQHQILTRMRSLGIIPVLPGFAGHVPAAITRLYPNASVSRLGSWAGFGANYSETYLLDFNDPLFETIGVKFIETMRNEFGVDHVYNSDSFNEMTPRSSDPKYLASAARGVYNAMQKADSNAIWVMQGWLFQNTGFWKLPQMEALLTAVPKGRMMILDLQAEVNPLYPKTRSFFGQPFIWCLLHNGGGRNNMYGNLSNIDQAVFRARAYPNNTMVGTGVAPEGINQNEVVYEFMNEMAWRTSPVDLGDWIDAYHVQRYGSNKSYTSTAWKLLKQSVYSNGITNAVIQYRPSFGMGTSLPYDPELLMKSWDNMVLAGESLKNSTLFRYDLVDVSKESLQLKAMSLYSTIMDAYNRSDVNKLREQTDRLIDLMNDIDTLLGSDVHFLLGTFTNGASWFATSEQEKLVYDFNSRNQVTLWGQNGQLRDYAWKLWSGLVDRYYKPRWQLFVKSIISCAEQGLTFNQTAYDIIAFNTVESPFSSDRTVFPSIPKGDSVTLATTFHKKYRSLFQEA